MRVLLLVATATAAIVPATAFAQAMPGMEMPMPMPTPTPTPAPHDHSSMPGMSMPMPAPTPTPQPAAQDNAMAGMDMDHHTPMPKHQGCLSETVFTEQGDALMGVVCRPLTGSGTSRLPSHDGGQMGPHLMAGDWMLMAHGYAWGMYDHQSGARGDDAAVVTSMAMLMAERTLDDHGSKLRFNTMLSLEPLMGQRGYPSLFATGETAHGVPLVDRQHPHDLFMELSGRVDIGLSGWTTAFLYGGPVAEPALGPSAFMHRASARYLPLAPISHHWFDSTHITYGVVTAGISARTFQIEGSAFRGREPDENRWDIETPRLDSWSMRATWLPSPSWAVQVSHGRLKSPEAAHPNEDEARTTASVQYSRGGLSAMLAFSAKDRLPGPTLTAWLAEANWEIGDHHTLFGRVENVANDELFPDHASPLHDRIFRVTKAEAGYAYRIALAGYPEDAKWRLALGGTVMAYTKPAALDAAYGRNPFGATVFARLSFGD